MSKKARSSRIKLAEQGRAAYGVTDAGRNPPLRCRETPSRLATNQKFNHANLRIFKQVQATSDR
jgi:hypothetical protein